MIDVIVLLNGDIAGEKTFSAGKNFYEQTQS